jgi:SAM-dependent methyltransferase
MEFVKPGDSPWFDYIAFDVGEDDKAGCEKQIAAAYGNSENRWFNDLATLSARLDAGSFDAVVMCNVLHEVSPDEWTKTLPACADLLKPEGNLLVVEDYGIPVGERAHDYGFLLLDEPELVALFAIKESDRGDGQFRRTTSDDSRYKDRLVAHLIGRKCVARISSETRKAAIKKLLERMEVVVQQHLRNQTATSQQGRSYARSTQLMANAGLWMKNN